MNIQNILTILRDLVYQNRFSEAIRLLIQNSPNSLILTEYIKTHSGNIKPKRTVLWWGRNYHSGDGPVGDYFNHEYYSRGSDPYGHFGGGGRGYHSGWSIDLKCKWKISK